MKKNRPPISPEARAILNSGLTRRRLFAGAGTVALGAGLASCASGETSSPQVKKPTPAKDLSDTEKVVRFDNWASYIDIDDEDENIRPTLEAFKKKFGITVNYTEDIGDNDTYYGKINGQLRNGQDTGKDIVVFTDWMASRLIRQGFVQKFDEAELTNKKNLIPVYQDTGFDPGRQYSTTWQAGFGVIGWNKTKIPGGLKTVDDLWKPEYKGKVGVLQEFRDTIGLIMMHQGVDISGNFSDDQFMNAIEVVDKHIKSGQIKVYDQTYTERLASEDIYACIGWHGDIDTLNYDASEAGKPEKWEYILPESGATLWSDNAMIPVGSPHKKNAEKLLNYYLDPKVAAEVTAYVGYLCPVRGAREEMINIDDTMVDNPLIFPDEGFLKTKTKIFRTLTDVEEKKFGEAFQKVQGN